MKILLLTHKFFPDIGGIESVSEMLATEFDRLGHHVCVLTWSAQQGEDAFPYKIIRRPKLGRLLKNILWADVILENNPCLRLSWPNLIIRKPLVVALHTWLEKPDRTIGIQQKIKQQWLKNADRVIACSEALRTVIFPTAVTIGNPYDNNLFKRLPAVRKVQDYVFLGRLVSDKGVDIAIAAFKSLLQTNAADVHDSTLTIIGEGEERRSLQHQAESLGLSEKVIFTGSLRGEALVHSLNQHRYMLIPSTWKEPFGIVALEGLACGCLPIVSDSGGLPDAVGKAGTTFKQGDKDSLLACMIKLKTDAQYEMQLREAADHHLQNHQSKHVSRQYLDVIKDAVISRS